MVAVLPSAIRNIITKNGTLFVPDKIIQAVSSCVVSDANTIESEYSDKLKPLYAEQSRKNNPITVDYSQTKTIDAYTVKYLPRNTLIPKVGILCCVYHEKFRSFPDRLRILDIGSGTGAVVLGLLDLFSNKPLENIHLDFFSIDHHGEALERQRQLVKHMGFHRASHGYHVVDLSDANTYKSILKENAPYSMIFAGNVLAELDNGTINTLIGNIAPLLAPHGILINVEAQNNAAKKQRALIKGAAENCGLHTYYPCPPKMACTGECWKWRTDEFQCEDIIIGDSHVETVRIQKAHWTIYSKDSNSIYDVLHKIDPNLVWGVAAPIKPEPEDGGRIKYSFEFCTEAGKVSGTATLESSEVVLSRKELIPRGTIVGIDSARKIVNEWDIVAGLARV